MEVALLKENVLESNEATMDRFLHKMNQDIHDMVELSIGKGHIALHCPNKRSMVLKEDEIVDSACSKFESLSISESNASYEYSPVEEGDLFVVKRQKVILKPLSPKEVNEDQAKMKLRSEK
ncbi:hypothetical protein CR513_30991, partial [Mucuna pruriens]